MNRAFNLVKRGAGGGGASASIYVTGLIDASEKKLPSGYTELEYIESTGSQWIDTGLKDSGGYGFECLALTLVPNISDAKHRFVGANGGSTPWIQARFAQSNFGGYLGGSNIVADNSIVMNKWYKLEMGGYTFGTYYKVDGIAKYTGSGITTSQNKAVYLFAQSVGNVGSETPAGGASSNWVGKMQYSKFFASDGLTLTRDYIPCKNPNDEVGVYDLVSGQFFGNSGTGTFIAGPEVVYTDSVTMTTPSGGSVAGVWDEVVRYEDYENPIMASNNEQGVKITYSSNDSRSSKPWNITNPSVSESYDNNWMSTAYSNGWVMYEFNTPFIADRCFIKPYYGLGSSGYASLGTYKILASVDGVNFDTIVPLRTYSSGSIGEEIPLSLDRAYKYYRVEIPTSGGNGATLYVGLSVLQFSGVIPTTIPGFRLLANEYGLHTITATNGVKTSTEEVLVDALMDYWVEMDLSKLYLYKYGDERTSLTGGWSKDDYYFASGQGTVYEAEKNIDNMLVPNKAWSSIGLIGINNAVNMSGYSKLKVIFTQSATGCSFNVSSAKNAISTTRLKYADLTAGTNTTNELDVSAIDTGAYVSFVRGSNSSTTAIYAVWLE